MADYLFPSTDAFTAFPGYNGDITDFDPAGAAVGVTLVFSVPGFITHIRCFMAADVTPTGITWTGKVWMPTVADAPVGDGVALGQGIVTASAAPGTWLEIELDDPVAVVADYPYRVSSHNTRASGDLYYVIAPAFFNGIDYVDGPITAYRSSSDYNTPGSPIGPPFIHLNNGNYRYANATVYPGESFNAAYYGVGVRFSAGTDQDIDVTDSAALTDAGLVAAAAPAADSATLTDAALVAATAAVTDAGALTDAGSVGATAGVVDSATMTDGSALEAGQAGVDVFTLTESSVVQAAINAADAGTLTDLGIVFTGGTFVPVMGGSVVVMTLGGYASLA